MSKGIDDYLEKLRDELVGCDPATIQDALADAEEHLRTALGQALRGRPDIPEDEALQPIIEAYGTPSEIASAYRDIEARTSPPMAPRSQPNGRSWAERFFGVFVDPRSYASLFYMIFSLVTGIIYFTWAVTGLSLCAGFSVLIIGLPFFALFLLSIQGIALVEGRIIEALLGVRMPRRPIFNPGTSSTWGRFKTLVSDKRSWTTIAYMILQLPLGIVYFTLFVTLLSLGLSGIAWPVVSEILDLPFIQFNGFMFYTPLWMMPLFIVVGVVWILLTMHLAKLVGGLHGALAKTLLVKE